MHQLQGVEGVGGPGQAEGSLPHGGSLEQMHARLQGPQVNYHHNSFFYPVLWIRSDPKLFAGSGYDQLQYSVTKIA